MPITGTNNSETLNGTSGFDQIYGLGGNDTLNGLGYDDFLYGGAGADALNGGDGTDSVYYSDAPTGVSAYLANSALNTGEAAGDTYNSIESLYGSKFDDYLGGNDQANRIVGNSGSGVNINGTDTMYGYGGNDEMYGGDGNDFIDGGTGREYIFGYDGNDTIIVDGSLANGTDEIDGGYGNDVYLLSGPNFTLNDDGGVDRIEISVTVPFLDSQIENLTLTGTAAINGTGNDGDNTLIGNEAANVLDGYFGNDVMLGGGGDDTLIGEYYGNDAGIDSFYGGRGDDKYVVAGSDDTLVEYANEGRDTVQSSVRWVLGANFEDLELYGYGAPNINGFGNALSNHITGNFGNNYLQGFANFDTLTGGGGNDYYELGDRNFTSGFAGFLYDTVVEGANAGIDFVNITPYVESGFASNYTLGDNIENGAIAQDIAFALTGNTLNNGLTGNSASNKLTGNAGNDSLNGLGGNDTLIGNTGDDTYFLTDLDNSGNFALYYYDSVTEAAGEGIDTLIVTAMDDPDTFSSVETYTVDANIENGAIAGAIAFNLTGNALANALTGNGAANRLNGLAGDDTLAGGAGSDIYFVDSAADRVNEVAAAGSDTVYASVSYGLAGGQEIETMSTNDPGVVSSINLTGNEFGQTLVGNNGNNRLNGGLGSDMLQGLLGNDTYIVDGNGDAIVEAVGQGTDTVVATRNYALGAGPEIEVLVTGNSSALATIDLTGNEFAQTLIGNNGINVLDGRAGADVMQGLGGSDTYYVDSVADRVIEASGGGSDSVFASVNYTLAAGQEIETLGAHSAPGTTLTLTGNELANRIIGDPEANILNGGAGTDVMLGFEGNDQYYVDSLADAVAEGGGGGTDRVRASISYTLTPGSEIEELTTADSGGTQPINLIGNSLAQTITGNTGNNVLDGDLGADLLNGLAGVDAFRFSTALGGGNVDTILGYSVAEDTIRIGRSVFAGLAAGALPADAFFVGPSGAHDLDDRIIYNSATGRLFFDADGNKAGGIAAVQFAMITTGLVMAAGEFLVI